MLKFRMVLEAIDRASGPLKKVSATVSKVSVAAGRAGAPITKLAGQIDRIGTESKGSARELSRLLRIADRTSPTGLSKLYRSIRRIRILAARPALLIVRTRVNQAALDRLGKRLDGLATGFGRNLGRALGLASAGVIGFAALFSSKLIKVGQTYDATFATKFSSLTAKLQSDWSAFLLAIGKAGAFDAIIGVLEAISGWIDRVKASGQLDEWAKRIGKAFRDLGEWLKSVDWIAVASGIGSIAGAIGTVVGWLQLLGGGGLSGLFNVAVVAVIARISLGLYGLASALGVVSVAGAPLWAIVAVIGAIAAIAFVVYRNWSTIAGFFSNMVDAVLRHIGRLWSSARAMFRAGVQSLWNALPAWFRGILTGASFVVRAIGNLGTGGGTAAPAANSRPRPALPGQKTAQVGGRLDIRISGDGARQASVQGVRTANRNVPIRVERGPAMAGAA